MPGVVVMNFHARIIYHIVILLGEIRRHFAGDEGFDFANDNPFHIGIDDERTGRHARAAADDQHRFRLAVQHGGNVTEHSLQAHILRFGRGFHFAADVKISPAVAQFRDGDRGVSSFAQVEQSGICAVDLTVIFELQVILRIGQ